MPLYNWTVVLLGQLEAPSQDAVERTLRNQTTISLNMYPAIKHVMVTAESGGILTADPAALEELQRRKPPGAGGT
jgi:hypothetical protein